MSEAKLQELLDWKEILELRARYFRTVDAKDWAGFRATFTEDCTFDFGDGNLVEGADAFVTIVREQAEAAVTVHRGTLPEVTIDSETTAHGRWQLNDYLEWPPNPETGERQGVMGYGHEDDEYRKVDGEWKISSWKLHYIRFDPLLPTPLPATVSGGPEIMRDEEFVAAVGSAK